MSSRYTYQSEFTENEVSRPVMAHIKFGHFMEIKFVPKYFGKGKKLEHYTFLHT
jgi:hypothetical protein